MRLTRAALLLGVALLPLAADRRAQKGAAARAAAATVKPIAYTTRTLANGLRVYAIRDTKTANVSVQVWYDVGSKDDPKGKSGFAHMFEHLMFKATRNLKSENFDRLTEDVGGYNNASTNDDYTNYYEVVPANHLQRLLFAEADRMASLVVEPVSYRVRARRGEGGAAAAHAGDAVRQALFDLLSADQLPRAPLCAARRSAASTISRPRRSTMSARSTRPITAPTMPCWSSRAISIPRSSTRGSTSISPGSSAPTARSRA